MTYDDTPDPVAARAVAERAELVRIAAATIVRNADEGRPTADEFTLAWAQQVVATTPVLAGPLGSGEPHPAPARI